MIIPCTPRELQELCALDPHLAQAVAGIGPLQMEVAETLSEAFISTIIAQQLSSASHAAVYARFRARFAPFDLQQLAAADPDALRSTGISRHKAAAIQHFAAQVCSGALDLEGLRWLDDTRVIETLLPLRGVGEWSARMLLIFGLHRRDVMILEDLGIRTALCHLHRLSALTPRDYPRLRSLYSPHSTLACFYLWEIANRMSREKK